MAVVCVDLGAVLWAFEARKRTHCEIVSVYVCMYMCVCVCVVVFLMYAGLAVSECVCVVLYVYIKICVCVYMCTHSVCVVCQGLLSLNSPSMRVKAHIARYYMQICAYVVYLNFGVHFVPAGKHADYPPEKSVCNFPGKFACHLPGKICVLSPGKMCILSSFPGKTCMPSLRKITCSYI
jgi:hypothetical protein